jgi:hypothetical protein
MKRLFPSLVVLALAGLTTMALAGDYHVGQLLVCSDCHVMHGSQSHTYPETGELNQPGSGAPFAKLLRQSSVNSLCLSCHDGRTDVPDVLGATTAAPTGGRLAGALNVESGHGYANDAGYVLGDGHTLWSTATPPGFSGTTSPVNVAGLACSDCHSAHGAANYRNMKSSTRTTSAFYNRFVSYEIGGTPTNTKDVYEGTARGYGWNNVNYQEPDQTKSAYGAWCQACHTTFHGSTADANIETIDGVVRHPTAGVDLSASNRTQYNLHTNKVKLMDALGQWDGTTATTTPSCFSCHKSHGNKNGFGLIWFVDNTTTGPNPPATPTAINEEGDGGAYRDLCRQCHTQGSFPAGNPTAIIP